MRDGYPGLASVVRALLPGRDDGETVIECRNCGTSLDEDAESCPACGGREIARIEVE